MKNDFVPNNYEKIYDTYYESVYNISYNDKFIKMICDTYNIKLYLVIQKKCTSDRHYICLYRHNNLIESLPQYVMLFFRCVTFKKSSTKQSIPMHSDFINKYDSFQMNVDECIAALKDKMIDALRCGFNTLSEYTFSKDGDFGTLPRGSSENEIMMKMKLMCV